ncbi:MAG: fatty acid desaturase [Gemmataceae bacterium]
MLDKERIHEAHEPRWSTSHLWLTTLGVYFVLQAALVWLVATSSPWWITAFLVVVVAHLMHTHVLALHEAAHGSLCPVPFINDLMGVFIAVQGLMSFSLYRAVHHSHHAYLSTERDEELWPFVDPSSSLWARRLAAVFELSLGLFFTPFLFLRAFVRPGSVVRKPEVRRRIWGEFALMGVVWAATLAAVQYFGVWEYYLTAFLAPAILAGNFQSVRKYIEHMGMTGATVLGNTRSIIPSTILGRMFAFSVFNIHYHGVHHKFAQMHAAAMPEFAETLQPEREDEPAPFPSYWHALRHMLAGLPDPRVGAQWNRAEETSIRTLRFPHQPAASARSHSA